MEAGLQRIEERLRESGLLDALPVANPCESEIILDTYRTWAVRLTPYLLSDEHMSVAHALELYEKDRSRANVE